MIKFNADTANIFRKNESNEIDKETTFKDLESQPLDKTESIPSERASYGRAVRSSQMFLTQQRIMEKVFLKGAYGYNNTYGEKIYGAQSKLESEVATLVNSFNGAIIVSAGPKSLESARRKLLVSSNDWFRIIDMSRLTVVVETESECENLMKLVADRFCARNGFGLNDVRVMDHTTHPCGYYCHKCVVTMPNGHNAEIQITIPGMLLANNVDAFYAKYPSHLQDNLLKRYKIPCGLSHTLYEKFRVEQDSQRKADFAAAANAYHKYFRSKSPDRDFEASLRKILLELSDPQISIVLS